MRNKASNHAIQFFIMLILFMFVQIYPDSGWAQNKQRRPRKNSGDLFQLYTVIVGKQQFGFLGQSLAADADLNGDGKQDVVVGANGAGANQEGTVYIFCRKSFTTITNTTDADIQITGMNRADQFGWALTTRGDFNGDGQKDLAVSALTANQCGRVYIFEGGKLPPKGQLRASSAQHVIISKDSTETFGFTMCGDGDINGDGINDLVISAPSNSDAGKEAGKVYIFQGGGWGDTLWTDNAACVITGEKAYDHLASALTCGGDITGDKIHDLVLGVFFCSIDNPNAGRSYVFEGRQLWNQRFSASQADLIIGGSVKESWLGTSVETIRDLNNDGKDELLIGASGEYVNGDDAGTVYLFYGGNRKGKIMSHSADLAFRSGRAGSNFGTAITRAGDIDGDGKEDWIISEPGGTISGVDYFGRIYLFLTTLLNRTDISNIIEEPVPNNYFGKSVTTGDINADGNKEVIIGAFNDNTGGNKAGKVAIFRIAAPSRK